MDEYPIKPFAIGGYRSFGRVTQYFDNLSKVNLFIGRNNSGKSNVLRFVHEIYPKMKSTNRSSADLQLTQLDTHIPNNPQFVVGRTISLEIGEDGVQTDFINQIVNKFPEDASVPRHKHCNI